MAACAARDTATAAAAPDCVPSPPSVACPGTAFATLSASASSASSCRMRMCSVWNLRFALLSLSGQLIGGKQSGDEWTHVMRPSTCARYTHCFFDLSQPLHVGSSPALLSAIDPLETFAARTESGKPARAQGRASALKACRAEGPMRHLRAHRKLRSHHTHRNI